MMTGVVQRAAMRSAIQSPLDRSKLRLWGSITRKVKSPANHRNAAYLARKPRPTERPTRVHAGTERPSPQPSPGVPGEGERGKIAWAAKRVARAQQRNMGGS